MPEAQNFPLFPLNTVLFPQGLLPLRIFEARYLDMVSRCLRDGRSFGICAIAAGAEVGMPALPRLVGTEARIVECDMAQPGVMEILVRGERRFAIEDHEVETNGLLTGTVRWLPEPAPLPYPPALRDILPLLMQIVAELGERVPAPHRFDDPAWVGARYAEILPVPLDAKQALLELDDVRSRLEIIQRFLRDNALIAAPGGA